MLPKCWRTAIQTHHIDLAVLSNVVFEMVLGCEDCMINWCRGQALFMVAITQFTYSKCCGAGAPSAAWHAEEAVDAYIA